MRRSRRLAGTTLVGTLMAGLFLLGLASPALASPPANDDFANADVVSTLPFTDSGDLTGMTSEPGEPASPCIFLPAPTAWYVFTPTVSEKVRVDTAGSAYGVSSVAYQASGPGFAGLTLLGCGGGWSTQPIDLNVTAGSTYYVQVGVFGGFGPANLTLQIAPVAPPANDNFVDAAALLGSPVSATVDLTAATIEPGEPSPAGATIDASAWYAYTPAETGTLVVRVGSPFAAAVAVYSGSSLTELTQVAASSGFFGSAVFPAQAGTTYSVQVARTTMFPGSTGPVTVTIEEAAPPFAYFSQYPYDPSIHDTVQLYDSSFDPANVGFGPAAWDFGDGTTATGCCPTHRWTADGDYPVTLTVTTLDGRTASVTQTVAVRTHDVSIERLQAPESARVGQAKDMRVGIKGGRYEETVQVDLYKSVAGASDRLVGSQTVTVPAGRHGRAQVELRYTFTTEDAATGKVTFRAVANLLSGRDALPADNQAIAPPTAVKR